MAFVAMNDDGSEVICPFELFRGNGERTDINPMKSYYGDDDEDSYEDNISTICLHNLLRNLLA